MPRGAPRTADLDLLLDAEESFRILTEDRRQHLKHPLLVASTVPAINALFQNAQLLVLRQGPHLVNRERLEPNLIVVGMRRDESKLLLPRLKITRRPLLALPVI